MPGNTWTLVTLHSTNVPYVLIQLRSVYRRLVLEIFSADVKLWNVRLS